MLWPVTSSARCWASRPRSAVWRPRKVETDMLGPRVEGRQPRADGRAPARRVPSLRGLREGTHQMVQEGQFLADEEPVLPMDACELHEQALELAALPTHFFGLRRLREEEQVVELDVLRSEPQLRPGPPDDVVAVALEPLALGELLLELSEAGEDALDVLASDRVGLGEQDPQQPPRGLDLGIQVPEENAHCRP